MASEHEMTQRAETDNPREELELSISIGAPTTRAVIAVEREMHVCENESDDADIWLPVPATPSTQPSPIDYEMNWTYTVHGKWRKLFTNFNCFGRILVLILLFILLMLSITYCIGQQLTVHLELIQSCPSTTTIQDIWHNSYLQYEAYGVMTDESQFGLSNEPCWTTDSVDIKTDQLWYSNNYQYQWKQPKYYQFYLFLLLSIYCFIIIIYDIFTIIKDIYHTKYDTLHKASKLYQLQCSQSQISQQSLQSNESSKLRIAYQQWKTCMGDHTTGWIVQSMASEIIEFALQIQALLLYNGYHILDPEHKKDVYLANKAEYILMFACIVAFNAFGSGMLWLSYSFCSNRCHGTFFKLAIFMIDQFSDLGYTIFPFVMIWTDSYNTNTDFYVLLAQLNTQSPLTFCASFIPLFILCTKSLLIINSARTDLRDRYYQDWFDIQTTVKDTQSNTPKEIYDAEGKVAFILTDSNTKLNWIQSSKRKAESRLKQLFLSAISITYITVGIVVLYVVMKHMDTSITHCQLIQEENYLMHVDGNITFSDAELNALEMNPELFLWDNCLYKVYPFTNNDRYRCQCRAFVVDWETLETSGTQIQQIFNLTQFSLLKGILLNWFMLERFHTKNTQDTYEYKMKFKLEQDMFRSVHMKAFDWRSVAIDAFESDFSSWKKLEYLRFKDTTGSLSQLPLDFSPLSQVKYLSFIDSGLQEIPASICDLTQLEVLQLELEHSIDTIPHCVADLQYLRVLLVDGTMVLSYIPLSLFKRQNIVMISLSVGSITYQHLLEYNLPQEIQTNDTTAVNTWFEEHFDYNINASYWVSPNPICDDDDRHLFPSKLQHFLDEACDADGNDACAPTCFPRLLGNGRCDKHCHWLDCGYDKGDCMQLCFAEELSNCSFDKLFNEECDEGCDNLYCAAYPWGSNFIIPHIHHDEHNVVRVTDMLQCEYNGTMESLANEMMDSNTTCESVSRCQNKWVGDGICDDNCQFVDECMYDDGDCSQNCVDDICNTIWSYWLFMVKPSVYKIDHVTVCSEIWSTVIMMLFDDMENPPQCNETLATFDFNNDHYMNFREFTATGYSLLVDFTTYKAAQVNCSACTGMEYYNI